MPVQPEPTHRPLPGRRSLLLAGAAGVAGLVTAPALVPAAARAFTAHAAGASAGHTGAVLDAVPARPVHLAHSTVAPEVAHAHPAAAAPVWARRWDYAVRSIDDFAHRDRAVHFPPSAIMLTIDDGPSPVWTPRYLRLLRKHHVRATFCMIGEQIGANRGLVREVARQGHAIANHTWTHDEQLEYKSAARIRSEIERTSHAIHAASGVAPTQFRAPGGTWGPRVFAELARQRLMPLGWDVDPADWSLPGTAAIEHTMLTARRHDIILCHDGGGDRSETYAALERVIPELLRRGHTFVTLPGAAH